jgi:hypothetical protein
MSIEKGACTYSRIGAVDIIETNSSLQASPGSIIGVLLQNHLKKILQIQAKWRRFT